MEKPTAAGFSHHPSARSRETFTSTTPRLASSCHKGWAFATFLKAAIRTGENPGLRREAFYSDLRPGSYRFRVIAYNNDGVWNET